MTGQDHPSRSLSPSPQNYPSHIFISIISDTHSATLRHPECKLHVQNTFSIYFLILLGIVSQHIVPLATRNYAPQVLKNVMKIINTILYCGVSSHTLQNNEMINPKVTVSSEILNHSEYSQMGHTLFILDNFFLEAVEDKNVVNAFTKG